MANVYGLLKKKNVNVFRRFSVRRPLADGTGNYETSWQDLSQYVIKWGSLSWKIDEKKYNFFSQQGVTIILDNTKGTFDHEQSPASFWNGYNSRYRTLVKIEAGFVDPDTGNDVPGNNVLFYGIITSENIKQSDDFKVVFRVKNLLSVLDEVSADRCFAPSVGSVGRYIPGNIIFRMSRITDGASNFVLRKFLSAGAWIYTSTSNTITALNTTTMVDNISCLTMAKKLAQVENNVLFIDRAGNIKIIPRSQIFTATVVFSFVGTPYRDVSYGHTIKKLSSYQDDIDMLYNRVIINYTDSNKVIKEENWQVGDNSTSWKYGVRQLEINNDWMNATTADAYASTLLADLNSVKVKTEIVTKFIPHLDLGDKVTVQYDPTEKLHASNHSIYDYAEWDTGVWASESAPYFNFQSKAFYIVKMKHNLDKLESIFTLREI